jgi:hypothetical protein
MNMRGRLPVITPIVQPVATTPPPSNVGKVKWGPAVWFFLHTVSVKIKDEHFQQLRVELLDMIYTICANLPCPTCSGHAVDYLKSINYSMIKESKFQFFMTSLVLEDKELSKPFCVLNNKLKKKQQHELQR